MILALIIATILPILVIFLCFYITYRIVKRKIADTITDFMSPVDDKTASPFAQLVDTTAAIFASRVVASVKGSLMGMESVASKNERKEQSLAMIGSNPMLAGLAGAFPHLGKSLFKNPALAALAGNVLSNIGSGNHKAQSGEKTTVYKF